MPQVVTDLLKALVDAMHRVAGGEAGVRVDPADVDGSDEHSTLAKAFDAMAAAIDVRHAETARLADDLRALATRVESLREEERSAIAIEIHDQVGQTLTALKLDLAWLERKLATASSHDGPRLRERIAGMMELVDGAADRVHNLAMELRPDVLDRLGLPEAVEWQARQFEQRTGIATQFETNVTETVEPRRATALFRIAQEALTNVARHADAHRVRVSLTIRGGDLALEVSDDGRGLAPGRGRLGLLGMRERALALGGDVAIVGPPGRGTVVTARLPLTDTTS